MILVTGATGFLGRNVVKALCARGHRVRCLVRNPVRASVLQGCPVEIAAGDVTDLSSLRLASQGVSQVVHLVAIIREKGDRTFQAVNCEGTGKVVSAAKEADVRFILHMSAIGAGPEQGFPYLYSKWRGEQEVAQSGIQHLILRPSLLFGPGDEFFNTLAGVVKAFPVVPVAGPGQNRFQPISAEDVAHCAVEVLEGRGPRGMVAIGGPHILTYNEILDIISRILQVRRLKLHVPLSLMRLLVKMMEITLPRPPITSHELSMIRVDNVAELGSVEKQFGFMPKPLRENLSYISSMRYTEAIRTAFGFIPRRIRDH